MKSFYFLAVFLALGLTNRIRFLHLHGHLLAFFLPQSLLLSACSQHLLLLIWLRILERVLLTSVFCPIESQPAPPSPPIQGKPCPPPPPLLSSLLPYALTFFLPVLYAGLCAWRTAHPSEWIKPRVGSRLWHLEGLTFSYILFCVVRN